MSRSSSSASKPVSSGSRLKALRESQGLSQADLAARIRIPRQQVHRWESLDRLSASAAIRAGHALGVSPVQIEPSLAAYVTDASRLIRGRITLTRCAGRPGSWYVEGTGVEGGFRVVRTADLGLLIAAWAAEGIEVTVPAMPPVE